MLAPVIVSHHGFRVFVSAHHLRLPVSQAFIQRSSDRRSPQIVRRDFADAGEFAPFPTMCQTIVVEIGLSKTKVR